MEGRGIKTVRSEWETAILVCRKCSKRAGGGFGPKGKTPLAKALRKHVGGKKGRKAKTAILETKCLSACPKKAVTVVRTDDLLNWKLFKPGTPIDQVADALGVAAQE
ncbi:hypothetical protein [Parasphingopyxis sp.]|uniref:hypothetical protein n=1 Tax=Parasphingopyxis sp. TaxID=1920299 RepID=UPI0026036B7A|nr:hypothetical protein [Parasphingopyxis sp.]